MIFLALLGSISKISAGLIPSANIVVFYSSTGVYSSVADRPPQKYIALKYIAI